jgi:hypothetical protein
MKNPQQAEENSHLEEEESGEIPEELEIAENYDGERVEEDEEDDEDEDEEEETDDDTSIRQAWGYGGG